MNPIKGIQWQAMVVSSKTNAKFNQENYNFCACGIRYWPKGSHQYYMPDLSKYGKTDTEDGFMIFSNKPLTKSQIRYMLKEYHDINNKTEDGFSCTVGEFNTRQNRSATVQFKKAKQVALSFNVIA